MTLFGNCAIANALSTLDECCVYVASFRWGVCFFDVMDEIGERMSEFKCPLLNQHGDADKLCTLAGSQLLQDKASSTDKTLLVRKHKRAFITP